MNNRRVGWGLAALALITASIACSTSRKSKKGESCEYSLECESGDLACKGGMCVLADFSKLAQLQTQCKAFECSTSDNCCLDATSTVCKNWKTACDLLPDAQKATNTSCQLDKAYCDCTLANIACDTGRCEWRCVSDTECAIGKCSDGQCVMCSQDTDCRQFGQDYVCQSPGACVPKCTQSSQCKGDEVCTDGHCIADRGCAKDRECVAQTKNVEAFCRNAKCVVPCQTDLECDLPTSYKYQRCIDKECQSIGCETDHECEILSGVRTGDKNASGRAMTVRCENK